MSECFAYVDHFIDYLISFIEECIKIPYENFFVPKRMIKNSPEVIKKVNYNSFSVSKNDNIEEDELNENEWDIV